MTLFQETTQAYVSPLYFMQALRVAPEHKLSPESVTDAVLAPSLHLEMCPAGGEHVTTVSACMGSDGCYTFNCQQKFKHKKGPDIVDRLLNSKLAIRLVNSSSKAVLASAHVDLLAMGLGHNRLEAELPLTVNNAPAADDPFTVSSLQEFCCDVDACSRLTRTWYPITC